MNQRAWAVIVIVLMGFSLYQAVGNDSLTNQYNSLVANYTTVRGQYVSGVASYNKLVTAFNSLGVNESKDKTQIGLLNRALNVSNQAYQVLLGNYSKYRIIYQVAGANQSIPIWGVQQTVKPNDSISWNLLDTFDNHITIDSNASLTYLILTQYTLADLLYHRPCLPVVSYTGTHFQTDAMLSEGCAAYVLFIWNRSTAPVVITPNVSATYAPTRSLTGVCSIP